MEVINNKIREENLERFSKKKMPLNNNGIQ